MDMDTNPTLLALVAGLANGDRLYSLGGRRFTSNDDLSQLIAATPTPIEVIMERSGRLRLVKVETLPSDREGGSRQETGNRKD